MRLTGLILDELVFAIPTVDLWKLIPYKETGFIEGDSTLLDIIVQKGLFRKRSELENDPSFKQIIPYAVISNKEAVQEGAGQSQAFYLFRRRSGQTEKRLHNKLHLGVGGHMNPCKSGITGNDYLVNQLKRELFEEVKLLNGCLTENIEFIGFINDDSIQVGTVHIGLLYNIHISNRDIVINETDKMTAEWIEKAELMDYYQEMETWTKIAVDYYLEPGLH